MDQLARRQLEVRIMEEVRTMLTEGDRTSFRKSSRAELLNAIETELQFLGLYAHDDRETPTVIHAILEQRLDEWCNEYLWQPDVQVERSPWLQTHSSMGRGIPRTASTRYIGFILPLERSSIQVSSLSAEDGDT